MGAINSDTVIIEFNGLPGTGKTTVCKALGQLLREKATYWYTRHNYQNNINSIFLSPPYYPLLSKVYRYANSYSSPRDRKALLSVVYFKRMYDHFLKDKTSGVLINDQGIIQALLSIAHVDMIAQSELLEILFDECNIFNPRFIIVNAKCDIETLEARVGNRKKNNSRIDRLSNEQLKIALEVQNNNIDIIRTMIGRNGNVKMINIDTTLTPSHNASRILEFI